MADASLAGVQWSGRGASGAPIAAAAAFSACITCCHEFSESPQIQHACSRTLDMSLASSRPQLFAGPAVPTVGEAIDCSKCSRKKDGHPQDTADKCCRMCVD